MRQSTWADNSIAFNLEDYDNDKAKLFSDVGRMLEILTTNGYQCAFRYDDAGIYLLDYDSDNPEMGTPMIYWLDEEQLECLFTSRYIDDDIDETK